MRNIKGQSLFEVVMALAVATIIVVGIVALSATSIKNSSYARDKTLAARNVQETIEWLRGERDANFTEFIANTAVSLRCFSALDWDSATVGPCGNDQKINDSNFKREITFSSSLVNGKTVIRAEVNVYWQDSGGIHEVKSVTDFSDWKNQ